MWGEIGLPGDEAVDTDVPAIMAGTLESCRLDDDDDRCNMVDEETESESCAWESLRRWYLDSCAVVLRMADSFEALSLRLKLFNSFLASRSFKKSEMLSSSDFTSPELPPSPSCSMSEPRCNEDATLPLPLLRPSSSVLLPPLVEKRFRRWPKLLLYLTGAGRGELDAEDIFPVSLGSDGVLNAC